MVSFVHSKQCVLSITVGLTIKPPLDTRLFVKQSDELEIKEMR